MGTLITFLTSKIGKLVSTFVVALGLLIGVYQSGRSAQRKDTEIDELNEYVETKKRIDDVETSGTRDDAIERLRDNKWGR